MIIQKPKKKQKQKNLRIVLWKNYT